MSTKHRLLAGLALACASVALSGCLGAASIPGVSAGGTAANSALHDFLTDPNCAHHDEATFVTGAGGLPASFQAKVMRDCPAHSASPAPAAPAQ